MHQAEKILEFDKIKEMWSGYALTEKAKQRVREQVPYLAEMELAVALRETTQAKELLEKCGIPPLVSLSGVEELLNAAAKGECLAAWQLEQLATALVAVRRLKDYLNRGKGYENALAYYADNLDALELLREEIQAKIYNGEVSDRASKYLQDIRREIMLCEEKMREKADAVMRSYKDCMSDSFSTVRNGRICIPVKKEYRYKISGNVIDKSATGSTVFIEPAASAKYYEELQQLRIAEEDEVRRLLYELTVQVDMQAEEMRENIRVMEKLDFAFAKGKLSLDYAGTEPLIVRERKIQLTNAKHPLLEQTTCVPLQFSVGDGVQGIVITGPNTGGKTVAIKTVALTCMMAQCGLHVPCEKAELCMNSNYLCDIGDGQNLSENLSTFSAHITNVLDILKQVNPESLVIMDELGSGTDPLEGMGIAVAILEELKKSGALFLVTTHYPEVKTYASREEGIVNARMTFDAENLKPLYQLVIGEAGESCALYIANRLGMPSYMLQRAAKAAYGQSDVAHATFLEGACESLFETKDERSAEEHPAGRIRPRIERKKQVKKRKEIAFRRGDSVMIYPDKKIGIVCTEANEKGVLQVQLQGKKIWINYKRVKLQVPASELYPEDYDFSIVFDTVENRKLRHDMERKYVAGVLIIDKE